ncbi:hypothetical protein GCWU000342_01416 [Shuttleworthella satelles DSM 14600]|uniref:Uncharacterized protein n=1 Tax=Shuttleworthella satelles DSM 14600 TaxID=626523 RepID=C4GBW3_9FIRM|nr:hypothetical protein GCWU000342_01416 [Shuttleworthia satelles DSM 14600]
MLRRSSRADKKSPVDAAFLVDRAFLGCARGHIFGHRRGA